MDQTEKASPPVTDGTEVTGADKTAGETHSGGTETAAQTPGETPVRTDDRAGTPADGTAPKAETGKDSEPGSASQAEAQNGGDGTAPASFGRVNVHELTRGQREAIARRVLRGERVEL